MGRSYGNQNNEDMYFPCRYFMCRTAIGFIEAEQNLKHLLTVI